LELLLQKTNFSEKKNDFLNGNSKNTSENFIQRLFAAYDSSIRETEMNKIEEGLKKRCDKTKNTLKTLLDAISHEKEHNFEIIEKLKSSVDSNDFKEINESLQKKNEEFDQIINSFQVEIRHLKNENNMKMDDITKSQLTIKDLTNELDLIKFDLSHANKTIDRLRAKNLDSPMTPMTPQFEQIKTPQVDDKFVEKLRQEIEQRKMAYDTLTNDFIHVQQDCVNLKIEIGSLKRDMHSDSNIFTSRQFQVVGHKLDETRKEVDYLRNIIGQYKKEINDLEKSNSNLYYQIYQKEEKKQLQLMDEISKKEKENLKLKEELNNLKIEMKNINLTELNSQLKRLSKVVSDQQIKISEYQNILNKQKELLMEPKKMIILERSFYRKSRELQKLKGDVNSQQPPEEDKEMDLNEEILILKEECETYLQELDNVAASFDEIQNKNTALALQLAEKDDKNAELFHEKVKSAQFLQSKEIEISNLKTQIETLNKLVSQFEENDNHMKVQYQIKDEQFLKLSEENRLTQTVLEKKNRIANDSQQTLNECKQEMNKLQMALSEYQKRLMEVESMFIVEQGKNKKFSLEYETLQKRSNLVKLDSQEENMKVCFLFF
jgi:chromosome segregation ATPase